MDQTLKRSLVGEVEWLTSRTGSLKTWRTSLSCNPDRLKNNSSKACDLRFFSTFKTYWKNSRPILYIEWWCLCAPVLTSAKPAKSWNIEMDSVYLNWITGTVNLTSTNHVIAVSRKIFVKYGCLPKTDRFLNLSHRQWWFNQSLAQQVDSLYHDTYTHMATLTGWSL